MDEFEYEIGDIVRVRDNIADISRREYGGYWSITTEMKSYAGKVATIFDIDRSNREAGYKLKDGDGLALKHQSGWVFRFSSHMIEPEHLHSEDLEETSYEISENEFLSMFGWGDL